MSNTLTVARGAEGTQTMAVHFRIEDPSGNGNELMPADMIVDPAPSGFPQVALGSGSSVPLTFANPQPSTGSRNIRISLVQTDDLGGTLEDKALVTFTISAEGAIDTSSFQEYLSDASQIVVDGTTINVPSNFLDGFSS